MEIETGEVNFSEAQLNGVREYARELEDMVKEFEISNEEVDSDVARETAATAPHTVFSLIPGWDVPSGGEVSKVGYGLVPGFHEDCEGYFIADRAFDERPTPYPYTEIHVPCVECDSEMVDEDGNECSNCEEGEFIFDLDWDAEGNVRAQVS